MAVDLRAFTPARVALGRAGHSLPTAELLRFQLDHARARDAVYEALDPASLGLEHVLVRSAARDRSTYLRRPDLGPGREDKIAAIGVRIRRWVTLHGVALNVDCDLSHYAGIVPCGVSDPRYGVTSLAELGLSASMAEVDMALRRAFEGLLGRTELRPAPPGTAAQQAAAGPG